MLVREMVREPPEAAATEDLIVSERRQGPRCDSIRCDASPCHVLTRKSLHIAEIARGTVLQIDGAGGGAAGELKGERLVLLDVKVAVGELRRGCNEGDKRADDGCGILHVCDVEEDYYAIV